MTLLGRVERLKTVLTARARIVEPGPRAFKKVTDSAGSAISLTSNLPDSLAFRLDSDVDRLASVRSERSLIRFLVDYVRIPPTPGVGGHR